MWAEFAVVESRWQQNGNSVVRCNDDDDGDDGEDDYTDVRDLMCRLQQVQVAGDVG